MNLFTPNLQFTLNASGPTGPVSPGAFLKTFANGDSLQTNVTYSMSLPAGNKLRHASFVFVTRPASGGLPYQPYITLYDQLGNITDTDCIGKVLDNGDDQLTSYQYGVFEADLVPYQGKRAQTDADYGDWSMFATGFDGVTYQDFDLIKINGLDPTSNGGTGSSNTTSINAEAETADIHLGWPTGTFSGNNAFELAMVRIYNSPTARLTDAQAVQVWDHWASNNAAYYENNGQALPSYNSCVEDYTTDRLAEWGFAKMPAGVVQTTAGSVGTVVGSLTGGAVVTV